MPLGSETTDPSEAPAAVVAAVGQQQPHGRAGLHRHLARLDHHLSSRVHRLQSPVWLDAVMLTPAMAFGTYGMPFVLGLIAAATGPAEAAAVSVTCAATLVMTQLVKAAVKRPRPHPDHIGRRRWNLRGLLSNPAFPSGDTAQAAAVGVNLALYTGEQWWLLVPVVAAAGRVHFGAHWIGDTVAGAAIGAVVTLLLRPRLSPALPSS